MKSNLLFLFVVLIITNVSAQDKLKDSRDGKTYETVKIGEQIWMAENLRYKIDGSFCFENEKAYCDTFGLLYTYKAATKACPAGWRLPSKQDFTILVNNLGGKDSAGFALLKGGKSGFEALLGGDFTVDNDYFYGIGRNTSYWSTTIANSEDSFTLEIHEDGSVAIYQNLFGNGYNVRCLKN